jgi:hypothetical protein
MDVHQTKFIINNQKLTIKAIHTFLKYQNAYTAAKTNCEAFLDGSPE